MADETKSIWLSRAQEAYDISTSFIDNNYRQQWEDNIRHFQNKHHASSKYNKDTYKYRSKVFRPKTRAAVRNNESAAAAAFFSNQDVVSIEPTNPNDTAQIASAEINTELLNYRLQNTIPWFLTCIGAFQDAQVIGVVASKQYWKYKEKETKSYKPIQSELALLGEPQFEEVKAVEVIEDEPALDIIPVENLRIHPNADWRDPVKTSPFIVVLIPMYVKDVKARMSQADPKTGQPKWKKVVDGDLAAARKPYYDTTRQVRDNRPEQTPETTENLKDYDIVWVHENIFNDDGEDVVFYTLGTSKQLTDPKPLKEVYSHGRPYVIGVGVIETHKVIPSSYVELGQNLQKETNEVVNQRLDNVKLVLNKRYIVERGNSVDLNSITRNVPGSVTMTDRIDAVKSLDFEDVTGSSYQEQDRLNAEFDELLGVFSSSSIMSNRKLNETVGGMAMLRGGAGGLTEYLIRVFAESWVEPVIKQMVKLEQLYETDEVILAIAADKAQIYQKYGIDKVTDEILNQSLTAKVNVGTGVTDPAMKVERFMLAMNSIVKILTGLTQMGPTNPFNTDEIIKEVFGRLGYKDGTRFINKQDQKQDPEKMQMMQQIEQMQMVMQQMQGALQDKQADREHQMQIEGMKQQSENIRTDAKLNSALMTENMRQEAENRRTQANIAASLMNPVSGERSGTR